MENIKRIGLNNRHKIVRLIHKGQNVQALEYCLQKGHLLKWKRLAIPLALADGWEPYGEYINRKRGDK